MVGQKYVPVRYTQIIILKSLFCLGLVQGWLELSIFYRPLRLGGEEGLGLITFSVPRCVY